MKSICSVLLLLTPCLGDFHGHHKHQHHERRHAASMLAEQQAKAGVELGAARIIHSIRGAESVLAKTLRGSPKLLLSEERLLHKASQLALRAGEMKAKMMHSRRHLTKLEASMMQEAQQQTKEALKEASSTANHQTSGYGRFASIAQKETQLLRGGRGILHEVRVLKAGVAKTLGQSDPEVSAKLEMLMDKVGGEQKEILRSEAEAASHASKLAASIREEKAPAARSFAQASTAETMGTEDPVKRAHLAQEALGQLKLAKGEITAAYGTDAGTAKKVEGLLDQLQGSLQGLQKSDEADEKTNAVVGEAAMLAKMKHDAHLKKVVKEAEKASLAQAVAHAHKSKRAVARRFLAQERHMQQLSRRTNNIAMEDRRISKEAKAASRVVDHELGGTEAGEEVSALLRSAASEARRASAGDRRLAALEKRQVHGLANMAAIIAH